MRAVTGAKSARLWLMGVFALAMVGCASVEPPEFRRLPERVELNGVPFFRGNANPDFWSNRCSYRVPKPHCNLISSSLRRVTG